MGSWRRRSHFSTPVQFSIGLYLLIKKKSNLKERTANLSIHFFFNLFVCFFIFYLYLGIFLEYLLSHNFLILRTLAWKYRLVNAMWVLV